MKLLTTLISPYGRKVRFVLAEKRIEFDLIETPTTDETLASFNPLGKVPCLMLDDEKALYDSRVIVEYLDAISPVSRLIPQDTRQIANVKRREALADGIIDATVLIVLERRRPASQQSPEWIERQTLKITRGLAAVAEDLGEKKWLMGDVFTLADIATACMLDYLNLRLPELAWQIEYPSLAAYLQRLSEEKPSFAETAPPGV